MHLQQANFISLIPWPILNVTSLQWGDCNNFTISISCFKSSTVFTLSFFNFPSSLAPGTNWSGVVALSSAAPFSFCPPIWSWMSLNSTCGKIENKNYFRKWGQNNIGKWEQKCSCSLAGVIQYYKNWLYHYYDFKISLQVLSLPSILSLWEVDKLQELKRKFRRPLFSLSGNSSQ